MPLRLSFCFWENMIFVHVCVYMCVWWMCTCLWRIMSSQHWVSSSTVVPPYLFIYQSIYLFIWDSVFHWTSLAGWSISTRDSPIFILSVGIIDTCHTDLTFYMGVGDCTILHACVACPLLTESLSSLETWSFLIESSSKGSFIATAKFSAPRNWYHRVMTKLLPPTATHTLLSKYC